MKKYIVQSWVNGIPSDEWEFTNKKKSLEFYRRKKNGLNDERKKENKETRLDDKDEWGYSWNEVDNRWEQCEGMNIFKKWSKVKEERKKNEN